MVTNLLSFCAVHHLLGVDSGLRYLDFGAPHLPPLAWDSWSALPCLESWDSTCSPVSVASTVSMTYTLQLLPGATGQLNSTSGVWGMLVLGDLNYFSQSILGMPLFLKADILKPNQSLM